MRSSAGIIITNEKYSFSLHFMELISDLLRLLKNSESLFSLWQSKKYILDNKKKFCLMAMSMY